MGKSEFCSSSSPALDLEANWVTLGYSFFCSPRKKEIHTISKTVFNKSAHKVARNKVDQMSKQMSKQTKKDQLLPVIHCLKVFED